MNELESFSAALANACIPFPGPFIADDQVHRYKTAGDKSENSWYALHQQNGLTFGAAGCWKRGIQLKWCSKDRSQLSRDEAKASAAAWRDLEARRAEEERRKQTEVREKCARWFKSFPPATAHVYLIAKGIPALGSAHLCTEEMYRDWLALPLQDSDGTIHSVQFIADDGAKKFAWGGRVRGCFFPIGDAPGGPLLLCEGYATGASIHLATGWSVICALNCGNLLSVAQDLRRKYPDRQFVVCADNDQFTENNPGLSKAQEVVARVKNCLLSFPEFADEALSDQPTDFNDLHQLAGLPEVARQIYHSFPTFQILERRRFNPNAKPGPLRQIYTLQDIPISTPGNLTTITSLIKTGKSAVISAMSSAVMTNGSPDRDNLGFKSANPRGQAVIHFDSEQSPDDHWFLVDSILRRASLTELPPWFYSYCLTGLGYKRIQECLREAILFCARTHHGIHSILLDGVADLVSDVNNDEESNAFVAELQGTAIEYDCTTIGVIHFNPGSEKSRGHLGSQLERKAETNLTLEKSPEEVTRIFSVKNRRAGIPRYGGPCFRYDEEKHMHVSCDPQEFSTPESSNQPRRGAKTKFTPEDLQYTLSLSAAPSLTWSDFFNLAHDKLKISRGSFHTLLGKSLDAGLIIKSVVSGRYQSVIKSNCQVQ
jgi:phage/plasmid primase-like uncharacterized protein